MAAWALAAICVVAAVLYAWDIAGGQVGNSYYSAAVKSMSSSVTNFLFGSFDAYGVFTVDKPPMSLWPQVVSVWVFGFHGWALLLPQVVEGVAAVVLLHRTVRRWAGENVALLAALILTLTPITVAINRDNNPDTLLVLLLVASAYALTRSLQAEQGGPRTRWLLWCAFFIGCGFVTKMLQAWIVVPGFAAAYLVGSAAPVRRRVLDVLAGAGVLIVSSFWWVALVDLWPGEKPYIGGSEDGTAVDLILGYNGFGRVFGEGQGPGGGGMPNGANLPAGIDLPSGGFGGGFGGGTGIGRMFSDAVGGQIGWLLPLALLVLVVLSVLWRPCDGAQGARGPVLAGRLGDVGQLARGHRPGVQLRTGDLARVLHDDARAADRRDRRGRAGAVLAVLPREGGPRVVAAPARPRRDRRVGVRADLP